MYQVEPNPPSNELLTVSAVLYTIELTYYNVHKLLNDLKMSVIQCPDEVQPNCLRVYPATFLYR